MVEKISDKVHIGELIAVSQVFKLNPYRMISMLENGLMEVFEDKQTFLKKYGNKEKFEELDWCELNNGKIFLNKRGDSV